MGVVVVSVVLISFLHLACKYCCVHVGSAAGLTTRSDFYSIFIGVLSILIQLQLRVNCCGLACFSVLQALLIHFNSRKNQRQSEKVKVQNARHSACFWG